MNQFELPSNIKQIGSIGDGPRIYMEDYVCTYLKQYAESGEHCEKVAFLIGKYLVIDGQPVLFVNGAVEGKYSVFESGIENFTEQSYAYAEQQIEQYFKGFEIIGWMQSQPGYSVFLNPSYAKYHRAHFRKPYQMLFVIDPIEKLNAFYVWNTEMTALVEAKGYFVYYDKNPGMQEYMLDHRLIQLDMKEKDANVNKIREKASWYGKNEGGENKYHIRKPAAQRRQDTLADSKRLVNMLMSLSAVLFIICFIMGAGLIQNDNRINQLEANLITLNDTYNYIVGQLRTSSAQPVFAAQGEIEDNTQVGGPLDEPAEELPSEEPPEATPEPEVTEEPLEPEVMEEAPPEDEAAEVINIQPESNIPDTYIVQQGDSLYHISEMFYGTTAMAEAIMEANGMSDPDMIFFGKILILPRE